MRRAPSVILIREWDEQVSGSRCCGRPEAAFLGCRGESIFAESRKVMEGMGPLYRKLRSRFGEAVEIQVLDPRNISLIFLLLRDFWTFRVGVAQALRTLFRMPVQAVVVNGRLVAAGAWPDPAELVAIVEGEVSDANIEGHSRGPAADLSRR